jgi:two-component system, NarL family, sensor histidine kinase UhpB
MDRAAPDGDAGDMPGVVDHRLREMANGPSAFRPPAVALFRRLFLLNALVLVAGATLLVLSPATVSPGVRVAEVAVLVGGVALMLIVNAVLLRASLRPLDQLAVFMRRVDLLQPGERLPVRGSGYVAQIVRTFNDMLERLEAQQGASTAHALAAQEGERQRIARELHDEIGQSLTVVLLGLRRTVDRAPPDLRDELRTAQETVRGALDEVRHVARRLRPGVLEDLGLLSALNALAIDFTETTGVPVERALSHPLPALSPEVELVLYRIAQESLTNVARHADASHVELSLTRRHDGVELRIADDGRGRARAREGAGIRGMRERALLVGARLGIEPAPRTGTVVRMVVPAVSGRS